MPAKSKSQQRLMGMVYAYKKGKLNTKNMDKGLLNKIKDMSSNMKTKDVKDFAQTKHADIKESMIISFKKFCDEGYHNNYSDYNKSQENGLHDSKVDELVNKYQVYGGAISAIEIKKWLIDNDEDLVYVDDIYKELDNSLKDVPNMVEKNKNK
jgi:hypothetical protein